MCSQAYEPRTRHDVPLACVVGIHDARLVDIEHSDTVGIALGKGEAGTAAENGFHAVIPIGAKVTIHVGDEALGSTPRDVQASVPVECELP